MAKVQYTLPDLPYDYKALEPVISQEIMTLHHDKHHAGYVKGANGALEKLDKVRSGEIEGSVKHIMKDLTFHLNGHLLHSVFWQNMRAPVEDNKPSDKFMEVITGEFGSYESFMTEYSSAAKSVEGSGWSVLAVDSEGHLFVHQVEKHNLYGITGLQAILVNDVWEHAYYLDYKNDRGSYVESFWKIVNWEYVEARYHEITK